MTLPASVTIIFFIIIFSLSLKSTIFTEMQLGINCFESALQGPFTFSLEYLQSGLLSLESFL